MSNLIYLDHAATTPIDPRVKQAMEPFLSEEFGNPSSLHSAGRRARLAIDEARETLAAALHCDPAEITFTGSGTEADNLAIIGAALAASENKRHIIISSLEHHAVLNTAEMLPRLGCEVTILPVNAQGLVEMDALQEAIREDTLLVSIMHANNEIGTIQPIRKIEAICKEHGVYFHTDAVQTFGFFALDVEELGVDMLTVSSHKIYGPKGVGALYARGGTKINPVLVGGGQERERRAGTENVAGIVGFAEAVKITEQERAELTPMLAHLRDYFIRQVLTTIPDAILNGHPTERLPNNAHFRFPGVAADTLLIGLDRHNIAASSGAACSSGSIEPSHVLLALGLSEEDAQTGVRFSLGKSNTEKQLDTALEVLAELVESQRALRQDHNA